jgi:uncharacterized protein YcbX
MPAAVTQLAIAPVKGMRLTAVDVVDVEPAGVAGDRAFLVVDPDDSLLLSIRTPALLQCSRAGRRAC